MQRWALFMSVLCLTALPTFGSSAAQANVAPPNPDRLPEYAMVVQPSSPPPATAAVPNIAPAPSGVWSIAGTQLPWLRMMVAFLFVASLILVVAVVARRFMGGMGNPIGKRAPLRIVQSLPVGMKRHIVVLDFEGDKLVVGMTGHQMQLLHAKPLPAVEIAQEDRSDPVPLRAVAVAKEPAAAPASFASALSSQIRETVKMLKPLYPDNGPARG